MVFHNCPRCGGRSLERLRSHSHCPECNYSPDLDADDLEPSIPEWAWKYVERQPNPFAEQEPELLPFELTLECEDAVACAL